jgi:hypothetical protein
MIPYIHRGPFKSDRVLICWDGGTPAARAVHDAMPFLRKAMTIDVVTITENEDTASEVSSTALITHLARHDLSARPHRIAHLDLEQCSEPALLIPCRLSDPDVAKIAQISGSYRLAD